MPTQQLHYSQSKLCAPLKLKRAPLGPDQTEANDANGQDQHLRHQTQRQEKGWKRTPRSAAKTPARNAMATKIVQNILECTVLEPVV